MTLRNFEFEKAARELIAEEIRRDPKLKKQRGQLGTVRRPSNETALLLFLFGMFAYGAAVSWQQAGLNSVLSSTTISMTGFSVLFYPRWLMGIYNGGDLTVLTHLPLDADAMWRIQQRRGRAPLVGLSVAMLCLYAFVAATVKPEANWWLLALAIPQAVMALAVAVHLAAYPTQLPWGYLGIALIVGWPIACFVLRTFLLFESMPTTILAALPSSWAHNVFLAATGVYHWLNWFWLAPIGLLLAMAPHSLARVRATFASAVERAFSSEGQQAQDLEIEEPEPVREFTPSGERLIGPTAVIDATLSGELLATPELSSSGLIERLAARWLTERERVVAGFIWFPRVAWTADWRPSCLWVVVCAVVVLVSGASRWNEFVAYFVGFLASGGGLPILRKARGFSLWHIGPGFFCAIFHGFPVGYDEVFRTILKANTVRILAMLPVWILYGSFIGRSVGDSSVWGAIFAGKSMVVFWLLQPILISSWMSTSLSMTLKGSLWALLIFALALYPGAVIIFGPMLAWKFPIFLIACVAAFSVSLLVFLTHRWFYRRRGLDCIKRFGT